MSNANKISIIAGIDDDYIYGYDLFSSSPVPNTESWNGSYFHVKWLVGIPKGQSKEEFLREYVNRQIDKILSSCSDDQRQ